MVWSLMFDLRNQMRAARVIKIQHDDGTTEKTDYPDIDFELLNNNDDDAKPSCKKTIKDKNDKKDGEGRNQKSKDSEEKNKNFDREINKYKEMNKEGNNEKKESNYDQEKNKNCNKKINKGKEINEKSNIEKKKNPMMMSKKLELQWRN